VRQALEHLLVAAQRGGTVRPDVDCPAKARELAAYLEGAAVLWLVDRNLSLVDLYRTYLDSFIATVAAPALDPA
jgi:hypothetical protein